MKQEFFRVGAISSTHGLKGAVKVYPMTETPDRFEELLGQRIIVDAKGRRSSLTLESVSYFKNQVILSFEEINDINQIEPFKGAELLIRRDQAVPLEEGEFYIADLIGLPVHCDDGRLLGHLEDVMETGANDVYVVKREDGSSLLIPAIPDCILKVDLEAEEILVHLLPGLEDL